MQMTIVEQSRDLTHVALAGRLDMEGVQQVQLKFLATTVAGGVNAIVDLHELSFTASLGMAMFIDAAKSLKRKGARLVLARPQPMIRTAMKLARIDQVVEIVDSLEDARRMMSPA